MKRTFFSSSFFFFFFWSFAFNCFEVVINHETQTSHIIEFNFYVGKNKGVFVPIVKKSPSIIDLVISRVIFRFDFIPHALATLLRLSSFSHHDFNPPPSLTIYWLAVYPKDFAKGTSSKFLHYNEDSSIQHMWTKSSDKLENEITL